jgi:hypothetical protein
MSYVASQETLTRLLVGKGVFTKEEFLGKAGVVDQGMRTKNGRTVAPKQNAKGKSGSHDED